MAQRTSANLIRALYNLSREHDSHKRKSLLNAGLIEMIKWFSLAAQKIVQGKMKLPKQTQKFMDRHQDDVRKLASAIVDPEVKRSIILKPGGGGFFGGVIIRSLIRWDGNKLMRKFNKKTKKPKKKSVKKPRKQKKRKVDDRFVTKRKSKSPASWQNLGLDSPNTNARRSSINLARFTPLRAQDFKKTWIWCYHAHVKSKQISIATSFWTSTTSFLRKTIKGLYIKVLYTLINMTVTTTRRRKMQNKMRKKSLIKTYGTFLEGLTHLSNKCRKKMIQESPKEVIDCVGECCINLIKGNVRLTNAQKNQLRARKQHIRLLSSKQVPLDTKKKIINQKGGALLGLLLKPLIAPIIGSVLGEIIKK